MSRMKITGDKEVARNLKRYGEKFERNLGIFVGAFAGRLEAKAVQDRSWTDRTSAARNSINGSWEKSTRGFIVALAIGVEYGKYLELANGGKYRVIRPTIDAMRSEFKQLPKDAHRVTHV